MNNQTITTLAQNELITPEETAKVLGVSVGTLSVWRSTGRYNIPFVKTGRSVKYKAADIQAFIDRNTCQHTGVGAIA